MDQRDDYALPNVIQPKANQAPKGQVLLFFNVKLAALMARDGGRENIKDLSRSSSAPPVQLIV